MGRKRWVRNTGKALSLVGELVASQVHSRKLRAYHARVNMADIDQMKGKEFELFMTDLFNRLGISATHRGKPGDGGADITLKQPFGVTVVQAKRYDWVTKSLRVDQSAVTEALASKPIYGAIHAMVVTNSYFTPGAERMARIHRVGLWDRDMLVRKLAEAARHNSTDEAPSGWSTLLRLITRLALVAGAGFCLLVVIIAWLW